MQFDFFQLAAVDESSSPSSLFGWRSFISQKSAEVESAYDLCRMHIILITIHFNGTEVNFKFLDTKI